MEISLRFLGEGSISCCPSASTRETESGKMGHCIYTPQRPRVREATHPRQAVDLMNRWAPIDPEDALELLGPNFTYSTVRKYAVSRLSHAPDEVSKDPFVFYLNLFNFPNVVQSFLLKNH
jgi:hypothetical protein